MWKIDNAWPILSSKQRFKDTWDIPSAHRAPADEPAANPRVRWGATALVLTAGTTAAASPRWALTTPAESHPHFPPPALGDRSKHSSHEPFQHTDSICKIYSSHPPKAPIIFTSRTEHARIAGSTVRCFIYARHELALINWKENTIECRRCGSGAAGKLCAR